MSKIGPEATKEFARLLQQLDVASLTLQFSGGGDEGGIQSANSDLIRPGIPI